MRRWSSRRSSRRDPPGDRAHAPRRGHAREVSTRHVDGVAASLEHGVLDVAEILAVDLQRQRAVAAHLEPVEVEAGEHAVP